MRLRLAWLLAALFLLAAASPSWAAKPWIGVRGNHLVDRRGEAVRLLGINRSGAEYQCVEGGQIFEGPTDDASIAAMASWHINAVRLPLNESCWSPPTLEATPTGVRSRTTCGAWSGPGST
jgi:hypothetical protein